MRIWQRYDRIQVEDIMDAGDAIKLCQYCWFNLSLHFGLRGAEGHKWVKKSDVVFAVDSQGKEYVTICLDFLSKNFSGGIGGREFQSWGRIQETCPVAGLKKLTSKLHPDIDRPFQHALQGKQAEEKETWFLFRPFRNRLHLCGCKHVQKMHKSLLARYQREPTQEVRLQQYSCLSLDATQKVQSQDSYTRPTEE